MGDVAGFVPIVGPVIQGIGQRNSAQNAKEAREREAAERRAFYDEIGRQFRDVPNSAEAKARSEDLFGIRGREIDRGMYQATSGINQGYSKRGMGGSGYGQAAQSSAIQQAAEERSRARAAAIDQATAEGQRGLLGQANISRMGDPFLAQMLAAAEDQYAAALLEANRQRDEYQKWIQEEMGKANPGLTGLLGLFGGGGAGAEGAGGAAALGMQPTTMPALLPP
jgi:hypothetical protein